MKKHLPKKWRKTISEITGCTQTYVSYVVLGERPANTQAAKEIMEVAEALAEKNKRHKAEFKRKLKQL